MKPRGAELPVVAFYLEKWDRDEEYMRREVGLLVPRPGEGKIALHYYRLAPFAGAGLVWLHEEGEALGFVPVLTLDGKEVVLVVVHDGVGRVPGVFVVLPNLMADGGSDEEEIGDVVVHALRTGDGHRMVSWCRRNFLCALLSAFALSPPGRMIPVGNVVGVLSGE